MKKYELVYTRNYVLAVDDFSQIKAGELPTQPWFLSDERDRKDQNNGNPIWKLEQCEKIVNDIWIFAKGRPHEGLNPKWCKKIIAHLPLNGAPFLEGVDVLPPLEVDVIGKPMYDYVNEKHNQDRCMGFIDGHNKAKEKYRFTEEDVRKAIAVSYDWCHQKHIPTDWMIDNFIQSLSQPKMPVGFECEWGAIPCPDNIIGCLVAHFGRKKTTNPEGRTQWVGKYIYE